MSTWSSTTCEDGIEKGVLRLGDRDRLAAVILPGQGALFVISPSPPHNRLGGSRLSSDAPGAKGARTVADHRDIMKAADEFDLAVLDIRDEYRRLGLERQ
jgi:hypothetical protein